MAATEITIAERNPSPLQRVAAENALDPFEPQTWPEMLKFAEMVSKTDFAPKDFRGKPEACAIAMLYGRKLGIDGLQAIQNVCVINGRPSVWGDLFWAIILAHPDLEQVEESEEDTKATVMLKRRGRKARTITFTQQDAVTAGLWKKQGPWTNYPKTMLLWRARTICGKAVFADALKGITSSYEAEDSGPIIEGTVTSVAETQPTTVVATPVAKITQDQAREFGKAWKANGFTIDQAKAQLQAICDVQSSLDITEDKYSEAMSWATKNPNWPEPAPVAGPDEKLCREMFGILGYDLTKQAQAIADSEGDWKKLAIKLNEELPTD